MQQVLSFSFQSRAFYRFRPRAGLVTVRQTFVHRCQNCVGCSNHAARATGQSLGEPAGHRDGRALPSPLRASPGRLDALKRNRGSVRVGLYQNSQTLTHGRHRLRARRAQISHCISVSFCQWMSRKGATHHESTSPQGGSSKSYSVAARLAMRRAHRLPLRFDRRHVEK
jgi:hypothetical protein